MTVRHVAKTVSPGDEPVCTTPGNEAQYFKT